MRFFLDSASSDEAKRIKDLALLDGVWLSVAAAETLGVEYRKAIRDLAALTDGPVLRGALGRRSQGHVQGGARAREARQGRRRPASVFGPRGLRVARLLAEDQVATCAAGCYSTAQALIAAKANV